MIAIKIDGFGGPEVLKPVDLPIPEPAPGEVLIRVHAAGVARADLLQRQGKYPPPPGAPEIPGLDVAGTIERTGSHVDAFQPGDAVCAIVGGGGYAEYCVAPVRQVLPVPENWSLAEAATLPENGFTVYDNLLVRPALREGEWVLVHGGTSGIGSLAIMMAHAWKARVITTAGTSAKCEAAGSFGAECAINYRERDFVTEVLRITGQRGVDVILDLVGGAYLERNIECLAKEGRLSILATQGGTSGTLNIAAIMHKRARVMGSTMRARTPEEKGRVRDGLLKEIWPLLPPKTVIRPVIDSTFPLTDASRAHERMQSGEHIGKILLLS